MNTIKFAVSLFILMCGGLFAQDETVVIFSDSPDGDRLYDSSFGFRQSPSELELAGNNDKFPVDTAHPFQGAHSLRLRWTSNAGGDWGMAVAAPGWVAFDYTQYDSIVYWINGPAAITAEDLPELAIEDLANKKSTRSLLGTHLPDGVDADSTTWQKVQIPIDAFSPGPENADFTRIKTIFHYQRHDDGVQHTAWLDEVRLIKSGASGSEPPAAPRDLTAAGYDSRIDLKFARNTEPDLLGYFVYRSETREGAFEKLTGTVHTTHLYSDFFGENDRTYHYYVTAVNQNFQESLPSDTVSATSHTMTEEELITSVQEAAFRYFYDYGHPVSGLARERKGSGNTCTSGGTGFGLMTMVVGAERGFSSRDSIAARIVKILRFLRDVAPRYHGAWSHWIDGSSGATIPFSQFDDGGDLVETAFLVQGMLTARQYFDRDNPVEQELRTLCTQLWEEVEWSWYRQDPPQLVLYWHWSPNHGWRMNFPIKGFNETMIVYLLAVASPTYPVPPSLYETGWAGPGYANGNTYYGHKQWVGPPRGGPLFFTHYSFLGFDPRDKRDAYCNYFDNNRNISLINRAYCIDNPGNHTGYGALVWGLTASDNPWGYSAHEPNNDNGTITPTAAVSAMPYVPEESIATLKHFYYELGERLWGEFGFRDAFNLDEDWFAQSVLAIDQGTMAPMIENYRTGLCWELFMANPEIPQMLETLGWVTSVEAVDGELPRRFALLQNYPNPFNPETTIRFELARSEEVTLEIFNLLGQRVKTIYDNEFLNAGSQSATIDARHLSSGVYIYRLRAGEFVASHKMVVLR